MKINNNDIVIIKLIQNGNSKEFEKLFNNYCNQLCNYLLYFLNDKDLIEQIVQELFISIWENRKDFNPSSIKAYLFTAVKNKALNQIRHQKIKYNSEESIKNQYYSNSVDIQNNYENKETISIIKSIVNLLPAKRKEIFILIKFYGLSYKETADMLGLSVKTVENQMGNALKFIRDRYYKKNID